MILKYTNTKSTLLFFLAFSSRTHTKPEAPHKKLMFAPLQYRPRVAAAAQKSGSLLFYDFYGVMKLMSWCPTPSISSTLTVCLSGAALSPNGSHQTRTNRRVKRWSFSQFSILYKHVTCLKYYYILIIILYTLYNIILYNFKILQYFLNYYYKQRVFFINMIK